MKSSRTSIILYLITVLPVMLAACSGFANAKAKSDALTEVDFNFLAIGMSYDEIVTVVGKPEHEVGNDKYVFTYPLENGREMFLTFESLDHLSAAAVLTETGAFEVFIAPVE